jgi:hypothetical protein
MSESLVFVVWVRLLTLRQIARLEAFEKEQTQPNL